MLTWVGNSPPADELDDSLPTYRSVTSLAEYGMFIPLQKAVYKCLFGQSSTLPHARMLFQVY